LKALQQHLIELEGSFTEDALKRDKHITTLQQELVLAKNKALEEVNALIEQNSVLQLRVEALETDNVGLKRSRDETVASLNVSKAEVQRLSLSLSNLEQVYQSFEADKDMAVKASVLDSAHRITSLESKIGEYIEQIKQLSAANAILQDKERKEEELIGSLHEAQGMLKLREHEALRLQQLLNEMQARFHSMDSEVVNKELIRNMVCLHHILSVLFGDIG
jgi:chromosome segregation ATPase